jgi:hypothetical protein
MGILDFFVWLEKKLDKPLGRGVLGERTNSGNETIITADSPEEARIAAVRQRRRRRNRTDRGF